MLRLGKLLAALIFGGFFLLVGGLCELGGAGDPVKAVGKTLLGGLMFVGGIGFTVYCARYKRLQGIADRRQIKERRARKQALALQANGEEQQTESTPMRQRRKPARIVRR